MQCLWTSLRQTRAETPDGGADHPPQAPSSSSYSCPSAWRSLGCWPWLMCFLEPATSTRITRHVTKKNNPKKANAGCLIPWFSIPFCVFYGVIPLRQGLDCPELCVYTPEAFSRRSLRSQSLFSYFSAIKCFLFCFWRRGVYRVTRIGTESSKKGELSAFGEGGATKSEAIGHCGLPFFFCEAKRASYMT